MALVTLVLAACGDDPSSSGTSFSQPQIYPVGSGYSWTYVDYDQHGAQRDTATVAITSDEVTEGLHVLTKCWLDGKGLCPFTEIVSSDAMKQSIMGEDCVLLRFPLETGQAWSTCHGLLIEVAGEESITLPTGRRFSVALRVDILEVAPSADASGMDTLLVESHHYAPGVGRVLTTNYDRETRAVSGRSALFEASIE